MNPQKFSLSLAATVGLFFIGCTIFSQVAPSLYSQVFESWYHNAMTKPLETASFDIAKVLLGFVTCTLVAWLMGLVWAALYNAWNSKGGEA